MFDLSLGVTKPPLLSLVFLVSPVPGSSARPPEAPGSSVPHLRQQQHPTPPYSAWKMDGGLSTGVEVCMAPGGDGTGGTVSVLDLRLSMSWRSVLTWTSCTSSLCVTSPNCSFKSEHSLQCLWWSPWSYVCCIRCSYRGPSISTAITVASVLRSSLVWSWTPFLGGPGPGPVLQISEKGRTEDWST